MTKIYRSDELLTKASNELLIKARQNPGNT